MEDTPFSYLHSKGFGICIIDFVGLKSYSNVTVGLEMTDHAYIHSCIHLSICGTTDIPKYCARQWHSNMNKIHSDL